MSKTVLHISRNDYEGIASAILCKYIFGEDVDLAFYNYNAPASFYPKDIDKYDLVISVGLKNSSQIKVDNLIEAKSFTDIYKTYTECFPEDFKYNNISLEKFYTNSVAYIDWSWHKKKLYYGKNIDDLCKQVGRTEIINLIAKRISQRQDIITDSEKDLLIFSKKIMTNTINNKVYSIRESNNKRFAIAYADNYEIELSNSILSKEKDIHAVIIINMDTKIARIKTAKNCNLEREISKAGGITNSNGGTLKFGEMFDSSIFSVLTEKL